MQSCRVRLRDSHSRMASRASHQRRDRSRYRARTRPHSAQLSVKPVLNFGSTGFFIMICNPHAVGEATSRGASGVGAGADDVQGLPFFLYILYRENISG
jgi:hypothetical protein